ncbi:AMP-binding enzyme [Micromonospora sp. DT178]|uniref:AMP-binding enzyme n=1 Tax=Micromonospora sp. DT178 TaxID=3393436 RepID=UPI003CEC8F7C
MVAGRAPALRRAHRHPGEDPRAAGRAGRDRVGAQPAPLVANSVVLLRDDLGAAATLVAYVVAERDADPDAVAEPALRAFLARQLPDHMVPLRYVVLPELPATANGKVDRRALPAPPALVRRRPAPDPGNGA